MDTAFRYTVLPGDTLSLIAAGISKSAGVTYTAIEAMNPGISPTGLVIGMVLNIPAKGGSNTVLRYTVMAGDTYWQIAEQLSQCAGMTYQQIAAVNPGMNPNIISVGQVINIPATGSGGVPVSPPASGNGQIGFWRWTWSSSPKPPQNCNLGLAFSGWTDIATALQESGVIYGSVPAMKYITLGGGNSNGAFNASRLQNITNAIKAGKLASYTGIAYDIEEGSSGLASAFAQSFAAAKAKGLKVLVTVSHAEPYGIGDANTLMKSFFADSNIDFLSPQLYSTGNENKNDYSTCGGITWGMYANAKAKVIPSIINAGMYADAQAHFAQEKVTLGGFIQWSQS